MKRKLLSLALVCVLACSLIIAPGAVAADQTAPAGRLEEMVVTATRSSKKIDEAPASVTVITREDLEKQNVRTVDEALRNEVGVYNTRARGIQDSTPNIGMHGIYGASRVLVLLNGLPAQDAYNFDAGWTQLPVNDIERIEVVRGPGSSLYGGNAVGGVINIITRKPKKREVETQVGIGTQNTYRYGARVADRVDDSLGVSLSLEGEQTGGYPASLVTTSTTTAGPATTTGGYATSSKTGAKTWVFGDQGDSQGGRWVANGMVSTNSTNNELNLDYNLGRFKYSYGEPNSLLAGGAFTGKVAAGGGQFYSISPASFLGGVGQEDVGRLGLTWKTSLDGYDLVNKIGYQLKKKWYTTATTGTYYDATGKVSDATYDDINLESQATRKLFGNHLLTFGASYRKDTFSQKQYNLSYYQDPDSRTGELVHLGGKDQVFGLFSQYELPLTDRLTLFGGLRVDDWMAYDGISSTPTKNQRFDSHNYLTASPKLSAVWNPLDDSYLRASAGKAFTPATLYQLYSNWTTAAGVTYYSNPDLKPEQTYTVELGGDQYLLDRKVKLSASVFRTYLYNAITSNTVGSSTYYWNADRAQVDGYELEASYEPWKWVRVWGNYASNFAKYKHFDKVPGAEGNWMTNVPQDLIKFGTDFSYSIFKLSLSGNYTGRIYTSATNTDVVTGVYGSYGKYWVFNGKLSADVTEKLKASVSVNNIFDETYYSYYIGQPRSALFELKYSW